MRLDRPYDLQLRLCWRVGRDSIADYRWIEREALYLFNNVYGFSYSLRLRHGVQDNDLNLLGRSERFRAGDGWRRHAGVWQRHRDD